MKYILHRPGKNAVGPFEDYNDVIEHMKQYRLIGYAIIPMETPGARETRKTQNVVGSGRRVHTVIEEHQVKFVWNHAFNVASNARTFLNVVISEEPDAVRYQIQLIKALRALASEQRIQLGLREARALVKRHPDVQKYDDEMKKQDGESK